MAKFILRRLLQSALTLFGISVLIFAWIRALPGGPAAALAGEDATAEEVAALEQMMGLHLPIHDQYLEFLKRAINLDFGYSLQTNRPVMTEIAARFPASLELGTMALLFAILFGVTIGYFSAKYYKSRFDDFSIFLSLIGVTIPVFFLAYLLKYLFAVKLGWLPTSGRLNPRILAEHPTGFYVLDGILTGNWKAAKDAFLHLILPALALSTIPLALISRITRAAVLDVLREDYIRTAEAKGLSPWVITFRHILRNALIPVITVIGLIFAALISGTVLTETVFAFSGVGRFIADAIFVRDYPTIQGFIIIIGAIYLLVNLLVDLLYTLVDPRLRHP